MVLLFVISATELIDVNWFFYHAQLLTEFKLFLDMEVLGLKISNCNIPRKSSVPIFLHVIAFLLHIKIHLKISGIF